MKQNEGTGDVISVLVIGNTTGHSALLAEALRDAHAAAAPGYRLLAHQANSLGELRRHAPTAPVDFVAVAVDTSVITCLEWLTLILQELPPHLFLRRTVLINATGLPINAVTIDVDALLTIASEHKVDIMSADVTDPRLCLFLAHRLVKYVEVSLGCHTSVPELMSNTYDSCIEINTE